MTEYLSFSFEDTDEFINTFDEFPLWSASFGLLLLKHLELKPDQTILDIGSGAGFPVLELAERLGDSCKLFGIDPWKNANQRARQKIKNYNISNVEIIDGSAEQIPFAENSFDLIISNLGINNFENPTLVFNECNRVLKPSGRLVLTTNTNTHWKEFHLIFEETLKELNKKDIAEKLQLQQEHRGNLSSISKLFSSNGFKVTRRFKESFEMKFLNGSAFLNHHFVKLGWLSSWKEIIPTAELINVFSKLEKNLNNLAIANKGLSLTVPMLYIEGEKS